MDKEELIVSPKSIHELAVSKGWWNKNRSFPELIALFHSEISEALDVYQKEEEWLSKVGEELADEIIRIFDACYYLNIDIISEVKKKHEKNKGRSYRHGNKRC